MSKIDEIKSRWEAVVKRETWARDVMLKYADRDIPFLLSEYDRLTTEAEKAWKQLHEEIESEQKLQAKVEQLEAKLARYREAENNNCCDKCRFKLQSEAWKYYTYPCSECRHRVGDHFSAAEAALQSNSLTQSMPEDMRDRFRESYAGQRYDLPGAEAGEGSTTDE